MSHRIIPDCLPLVCVGTDLFSASEASQHHCCVYRCYQCPNLLRKLSLLMSMKTHKFNTLRVCALCVVSILMLGFSMPEISADYGKKQATKTFVRNKTDIPTLPGPDNQAKRLTETAQATGKRPVSFAPTTVMGQVLGKVTTDHWTSASSDTHTFMADKYSGTASRNFRGVGFPDFRAHKSVLNHYDIAHSDPLSWQRMVLWRERSSSLAGRQPIAAVRCMGLSPQAVAKRADKYESLILAIAVEHGISASLVKAVITEESCFNKRAVSPAGALGLMQLMPDTADWLKAREPMDPEDNIRAGVRYLVWLKTQFDSLELVLAAYNAGPGNVRKYGGVPPFRETQAYVQKVQAHYRRYVVATRLAAG